jgi:predicted KAP-like P-loop ATPase
MSELKDLSSSTVKILTDEVEIKPFLDFGRYRDTILKIIYASPSNFAIGIYGEWGTGKTTLMQSIFNQLNENNHKSIIPVWFNAWRYEGEEYFALIPLMKTIALAVPERI